MEFMAIYRARDPRQATARFAKWTPPDGYQLKTHYFSPDGRGFAVVDAASPVALVAAMAAFTDVMEFEFVPVAPIEEAMAVTIDGFAWADSVTVTS